ncbi:MAG: gas vesicle protein [Alkalicoccus sp.]|jgi:sensor histidine kinase YesM|uniref:Gas vesicle protein n=1 Tax=Alkalicoccus saliphilus TaxID=200989 RepID=A0A2T4U7G6_9BACI|nr:gas vesicle protein [Alkalicoccus saliphilus]PTL39312.1 gas vesicle protein [Alkalicoccus saliphilus]TVP84807.1 MAG: gas vesicle protein [Alkalicoccus sp.]
MSTQDPVKHPTASNSLVDVLETVLDKGVVIAGDISISLADVELITIRIRLLIASVDKAKEIGMDWWETDPYYSSKGMEMQRENQQLQEQIQRLEERLDEAENKS